jgi:hypothetical protein
VVKNDLRAMRLVFYASMFIDRKRGIACRHILTDMTEGLELNGLQPQMTNGLLYMSLLPVWVVSRRPRLVPAAKSSSQTCRHVGGGRSTVLSGLCRAINECPELEVVYSSGH